MKKVAIITGCAKGIGKDISIQLANYGFDIVGTYNTSYEEIIELKRKIENRNANFNFYKLDLTNQNEIASFCKDISEKYNKIDLLINNASLSIDDEFLNKTREDFINVFDVNVIGPFLIIKNLYKLLQASTIINISSTDAINTFSKLNIDYSASKAALVNLTKSMALCLEQAKLYAICPNWVDTESIREMNPEYLRDEMKRIGQKELIKGNEVSKKVIEILNSNLKTGTIIVMNGEL